MSRSLCRSFLGGARSEDRIFKTLLCLSTFLSLTCGSGRGEEQENPNQGGGQEIISLDIRPTNDILLVDLNSEGTLEFKARGFRADGTSLDVSSKVVWSLENREIGRFVGRIFRSAQLGANKVDFSRVYAKYKTTTGEVSQIANLTVVWLRKSGGNKEDFFFSLPYRAAPQRKPLKFSTEVQSLDVYFAVDTTGSMSGEINELARTLQMKIIPDVKKAAAKDAWFGVGAIDDWPVSPYGNANCNGGPDDQPLVPIQPMTDDLMKADKGVSNLMKGFGTRGCGADTPEGQMEALYQIATGEGLKVPGVVDIPSAKDQKLTGIGGVGFRDGALPVIVCITDASFHTKNEPGPSCGGPLDLAGRVADVAHDRKQMEEALNKICGKVVGVSAEISGQESCIGTKDLIRTAKATGTRVPPEAWDLPMRPNNCPAGQCCTGLNGAAEKPDDDGFCNLVFKITGSGQGLGDATAVGIASVARYSPFDVVTNVVGVTQDEKGQVTLPMGKTTADFIKSILPLEGVGPMAPPVLPAPEKTEKGFAKVYPGSFVSFTIEAYNDIIRETQKPQVFHATIRIRAGGCANLDERDVIILIPPTAPVPG